MAANNLYSFAKSVAACIGAVIGYIQPTIPFGLICTIAVLLDCVSAWQLHRRVLKKHGRGETARFSSQKMTKIFNTILMIYAVIVLAYLIDVYILTFTELYLANIVAGAFCFCQIWSILENESSENDATWARILQKIMVDKAKRHLEIDLSDLTEKNEEPKDTKE